MKVLPPQTYLVFINNLNIFKQSFSTWLIFFISFFLIHLFFSYSTELFLSWRIEIFDANGKYVFVLFDLLITVDLRQNSETYGKSRSVILSGENKKQFFIPRDFAHGFITLSKKATMIYKVDNDYSSSHESGIIYNDSYLNIDWILNKNEFILSERDLKLKSLSELKWNEKSIYNWC